MYKQGQKKYFFRPIFRRKIGFRLGWKRFWEGKIGSKQIGEKSGKIANFLKNAEFLPIFRQLIYTHLGGASGPTFSSIYRQ